MSTQMGTQERMHDNSSWIFGTSAQLEVKLINIMCLTRHIPKYESRRQALIKNMLWTKIKIKYKAEQKCEAHIWINLTKFFMLHSKYNLWLSFSLTVPFPCLKSAKTVAINVMNFSWCHFHYVPLRVPVEITYKEKKVAILVYCLLHKSRYATRFSISNAVISNMWNLTIFAVFFWYSTAVLCDMGNVKES